MTHHSLKVLAGMFLLSLMALTPVKAEGENEAAAGAAASDVASEQPVETTEAAGTN